MIGYSFYFKADLQHDPKTLWMVTQRRRLKSTFQPLMSIYCFVLSSVGRRYWYTHSFVLDQVMNDGQTAIVLLDPRHPQRIAFFCEVGLQFGRTGLSYTGNQDQDENSALPTSLKRTFNLSDSK